MIYDFLKFCHRIRAPFRLQIGQPSNVDGKHSLDCAHFVRGRCLQSSDRLFRSLSVQCRQGCHAGIPYIAQKRVIRKAAVQVVGNRLGAASVSGHRQSYCHRFHIVPAMRKSGARCGKFVRLGRISGFGFGDGPARLSTRSSSFEAKTIRQFRRIVLGARRLFCIWPCAAAIAAASFSNKYSLGFPSAHFI